MNLNSRAAITDANKEYIEGRVREIGNERGLEVTTEWEDQQDIAGNHNLRVNVPKQGSVFITFGANELGWTTYYPEEGEDVERFLEDEKKSRPESYERKQQWDEQIRQALSGFGGGPIGFS